MANFRSTTVTNTSTIVNLGPRVDVWFINIINRHSAAIFVRFYDAEVATFQDIPIATYQVAANSFITLPIVPRHNYINASNGLCVRVSTGATDSDNTAAATLPIIELKYN